MPDEDRMPAACSRSDGAVETSSDESRDSDRP